MAALAPLLAFLLFLPSAALAMPPSPHEVLVQGSTSDLVHLAVGDAVAYHLRRAADDRVAYAIDVTAGGPIDVYLMPAREYYLYRDGVGGSFAVPYSAQATLTLHRTLLDPDLQDVYLVLDNRPGVTGANPTGPVSARVTIDQQGPSASGMALGILGLGGIVAALALFPPMARRLRRRLRARHPFAYLPPEGGMPPRFP